MHAATSKVEHTAQGSSCQLKLVHGPNLELKTWPKQLLGYLLLDIALPDEAGRLNLLIPFWQKLQTKGGVSE